MSLAQDDHVVEKLAADGADHPLGEGVLPRRLVCVWNAAHRAPKRASTRDIAGQIRSGSSRRPVPRSCFGKGQ